MDDGGKKVKIKSEPNIECDPDPIVKEIPIFVSKRLEKRLFLFQYPLRQKTAKDEVKVRKGFFKPVNKEVKLDVDINVESSKFDNVKAEYIAQQYDKPPSDSRKKEKFFENDIVDKVQMTSTKVVKDASKYAVGAFNGRELHLTSLEGILQLRPTFPYFDKGLKRKKDQDADSDEDYEPGPSTAQQVTVKFKQAENDMWKKMKETSYKALQQKSAEEPWIECKWYEEKSAISNVEKLKLYSENLDETKQADNLTNEEYIRILVPEDKEQYIDKPSLPSHVMSLHALRAQPLPEQCRLLLKDAKIIQFQQLRMLLAGGEGLSSESLLKALPKVAVLVQGNWVVKSEVLYPEKTFSAVSGVPAEIMCRARDYVLHLFTKAQYVERRKVSSIIRIPAEELKEIFTGISKLRHNKVWELALPKDQEFIDNNPDVVHRQNSMWEQRSKQLSEYIQVPKERKRHKSKSISEDNKVIKNGPSVSRDCNISSDNDSGTEKNKSPIASRKNKSAKTSGDSNVRSEQCN